jgi:hypothetical protein
MSITVFPVKEFKSMRGSQSKMLMILAMANDVQINELYEDMMDSTLLQIIDVRNEKMFLNLSKKVMLLCAALAETPAAAIMILIDYMSMRKKYTVTIENICEHLYPMGFFTDEAYEKNWDWLKENHEDLEFGFIAALGD